MSEYCVSKDLFEIDDMLIIELIYIDEDEDDIEVHIQFYNTKHPDWMNSYV